jgi:pimeloyl-ACP methyl ester carboxylesterase
LTRIPLVLVPGIQGRWEYMRPTVDALSADFDVVTFSLRNAPTIDEYVEQVRAALSERGIDRAIVCGVSFGGVIALRFAAAHTDRTSALVLASTPGPGWHLKRRHELYARLPRLFGPLFLVEAPLRMRAEIAAALPDGRARRRFKARVLQTALSAPISFSAMAARARMIETADLRADCARIVAPTLVLTGDPALDHIVPADGSLEYARLIRRAQTAVLERSGHLGFVTRPGAFTALVREFMRGVSANLRADMPRPGAA